MDNSTIRQGAKFALKGKTVNTSLSLFLYGMLSCVGFTIALVIGVILIGVTSFDDLSKISQNASGQLSSEDMMTVLGFYGKFIIAYIVGFILLFIGIGMFSVGLYRILLSVARGQQADIGELFRYCRYAFKVVGLMFMIGLFSYLWSLLFIIPGIIKAYSYSMAMWILADDPEKGIMQCIDESKQMMQGRKWQFFCLTFSFIGWAMLVSLVMIVPIVGFIAFYVGYYVLLSYMFVSQAAFYLAASGQIQPTPVNMQYNQNYNMNGYGQGNMMQNNIPQNNISQNNIPQNNIIQNNAVPNNIVQGNDETNDLIQ